MPRKFILGTLSPRASEGREISSRAQLDATSNRTTEILKRKRTITRDNGVASCQFFGGTAEFCFKRQSLYEIRIAQQNRGSSIKTRQSQNTGPLPHTPPYRG